MNTFKKVNYTFLGNLINYILDLRLIYRKTILVSLDFISINISIFLSVWLSGLDICKFYLTKINFFIFIGILTSLLFILTGQYQSIIRLAGKRIFYSIFKRNTISLILFFVILYFFLEYIYPIRFWLV